MPKRFLLLILTSTLIACGSGASGETTTTSAPAASSTTTTAAAPVYTVESPTLAPPDPMTNSEGASGSGCPDGGGPPNDGVWYGYVTAASPSSVTFEMACFYFGDIAWEKAAENGTEAPNDVYIIPTGQVVEVPVIEGATAYTVVAPANAELRIDPLPYSDWPQDPIGYTPCPGEFCSVWLYVNNDVVTEILEQYLP